MFSNQKKIHIVLVRTKTAPTTMGKGEMKSFEPIKVGDFPTNKIRRNLAHKFYF